MRFIKYFFGILVLTCFSSVLQAEDAGKIEVVGPGVIDFGEYPAWEKKVARYRITNRGKGDLEIIKVRKTCGCAAASCDKSLIRPGETGTVEVVIMPDSIFNLYSKNTFVESSDTKNRFLKLNVAGNAVPLVDIGPRAEIYAGRIKQGASWSQTFVLTGKEDIELGKPRVKSDYDIKVDLKKISSGSYHLTAVLNSAVRSGDLKCSIEVPVEKPVLDVDGVQRRHKPLILTINGRIGCELAVVPGIVRMSVSDQPVTRKFRLHVMGQRSRVLKTDEISLPTTDDAVFKVSQERGGQYLAVQALFSPEFTRMLYAEKSVPLEFSVPGAASARVVCKIRQ